MQLSSYLSLREPANSHRVMTLLVLALGAFTLLLGDMVPANDGLGWDGVMYATLTRNVFQMITDGQLNSYYAQRLLPSIIVRGLLTLANLPLDNPNIVKVFFLYNWVLLLGASLLWKRIADCFTLTVSGRWLGFAAIFVNFSAAKQAFYYPVLTDVTALFVGMLLLLFYVQRRALALLITAIVGAFAWQVVGLSGAILLFFLNFTLSAESIAPAAGTAPGNSPHLLARMSRVWLMSLVAAAVIVMIAYAVEKLLGPSAAPLLITVLHAGGRVATGMPALLAVIIGLALLVNSRALVVEVIAGIKRIDKRLLIMALAAVLIPWLVVRLISNPAVANPSGLGLVAQLMVMPPNRKLLLSLVTNFVFWGPMILLLLIKWEAFCVEARRLGPGYMCVIGFSTLLCLVAEPRFMTSAWPFFVLGGVLMMEKMVDRRPFFIVFAVLTVLLAQFWLKINLAPWDANAYADLDTYPKQVYFMHYGLWMSWTAYFVQLLLLGAAVVWMKKSLRHQDR